MTVEPVTRLPCEPGPPYWADGPEAPMILACVLECSSIGAMVFLTIVVVITRIGVNKDLPEKKPDPASPEAPDPPPPVS